MKDLEKAKKLSEEINKFTYVLSALEQKKEGFGIEFVIGHNLIGIIDELSSELAADLYKVLEKELERKLRELDGIII